MFLSHERPRQPPQILQNVVIFVPVCATPSNSTELRFEATPTTPRVHYVTFFV